MMDHEFGIQRKNIYLRYHPLSPASWRLGVLMGILLFFLCRADLYAASVSYFHNGNKDDVRTYSDIQFQKIDSEFVSFLHQGNVYVIRSSWLISKPEVATNNVPEDTAPDGNDIPVRKIRVKEELELPSALAAYILHGRYLFGAGQSDDKYYGKEVTVSGVVDISKIRQARTTDMIGMDMRGQYLIPMLNGGITCIAPSVPRSLAGGRGTSSRYRVLKFKGIVHRSQRYKEAFIVDAKYISSRSISERRRCRNPRVKDDENRVVRKVVIASSNDLASLGILEHYYDGRMGRVACVLGDDPESYAMELHWTRKLNKSGNIGVVISGIPERDGAGRTRLLDCRIVGWGNTD